jgi:CBS domain-containing protein
MGRAWRREGPVSDPDHVARPATVRDAMLPTPTIHPPSAPVADIRALLVDDHVHMALIVERARLVATVEWDDLPPPDLDRALARSIGVLAGRTVRPGARLHEVAALMRRRARRRLAVVDARGDLLGLLCLKASGNGFCSADDVRERRAGPDHPKSTRRAAE